MRVECDLLFGPTRAPSREFSCKWLRADLCFFGWPLSHSRYANTVEHNAIERERGGEFNHHKS